jgi:hypothetical protein
MSSIALQRLRADSLFSHVPDKHLARLLGSVQLRNFERGQQIYSEGQPAADLYMIIVGTVELTARTSIERNGGERFGVEALAGLNNYRTNATALEDGTCLCIPRRALQELSVALPSIREAAIELMLDGAEIQQQNEIPVANAGKGLTITNKLGWITAFVAPIFAYVGSVDAGLPVETAVFIALLTMTVMMWVFTLVDEFIPPLIMVVATLFAQIMPINVALSGFASASHLTLLGVFALASTIALSGLSYRVILWLLEKVPDTSIWHEAILVVAGYALSPFTPSGNNRISLLLPLYRDMLQGLSVPKRGKAATALMAACFSGAMLFSPMMATSKTSNLVSSQMLSPEIREVFLGVTWLVSAGFVAVFLTVLHFIASRFLYAEKRQSAPLAKNTIHLQLQLLGPLQYVEKIAIAALLFFLVGSATTSWHHVQASWLAGMMLVGFLLTGILGKKEFRQNLDWPMIFFLLSIDGITKSMDYLGVTKALGDVVTSNLAFVDGRIGVFILVALVVTSLARLALPVLTGGLVAFITLLPVAESQGIHPWICLFLTALFSDIWLFPYQSSVYLQALSQGFQTEFDERGFKQHNMIMNIGRVVACYLSIPYWQWLGLL